MNNWKTCVSLGPKFSIIRALVNLFSCVDGSKQLQPFSSRKKSWRIPAMETTNGLDCDARPHYVIIIGGF